MREVPYDGCEPPEIRQKVEKGEPLKANYGLDQRITQLINDCRSVQASDRPSFKTVVESLEEILADSN